MANVGDLHLGVKFDTDQASLSKVKSALKEIQNMTEKDLIKISGKESVAEIEKVKKAAADLQGALERSFNADLGSLNVSKFNQELQNLNLKEIQNRMSDVGAAGQRAFRDIVAESLTTNMQLKQTNNFLERMSTTMANTIKWGIASSVMNSFTGSVQEAFGYIKNLDTSLNNIRIVTGQSSEEMSRFAVEANNAAVALGRQTREYTDAALTFVQQGLDDTTVRERTEATLKAANITGENTKQMAEYLTAVWNGFQVATGEEERVVSKLAAVADSSASNMAELATGMSKVSAMANSMGVDVDQLNAQLATIVSVTRAAPETVGNALKTIYARIGDIKAGADEAEVSLGHYSAKMAELGFSVLDSKGKMRDLGEVIEEIGNNWGSLTREQQESLAQTMAGQRQFNNLITLFDNWDKYIKEVNISMEANGELDEKNAIYMDSLAAKMKALKGAKEDLLDSLLNADSFKGIVEALTVVVQLMSSFVDSIGGGGTVLLSLSGIATRVFSKQIASSIHEMVVNFQNAKSNAAALKAQMDILAKYQNADLADASIQKLIEMKEKIINLSHVATEAENNTADEMIKQTRELQRQEEVWQEKLEAATKYYNTIAESQDNNAQQMQTEDFHQVNEGSNQYTEIKNTFAKQADEINEELKNLKGLKDAIHDVDVATTELREAEREQIKVNKEFEQSYGDLDLALENNVEQMDKYKRAEEQLEQVKQKNTNANNKIESALESLYDQVDKYGSKLEEFEANGQLAAKGLDSFATAAKASIRVFKEGFNDNASGEELANLADKVKVAYRTLLEEMKKANNEAANTISQEMAGRSEQLKEALRQTYSEYENWVNNIDLRGKIEHFTNMAGAVAQLASGFSSLKNLVTSVWTDDSLSGGEKVLQTLTNIGFSLPSIISAYGALKKELGVTTNVLNVLGTALDAHKAKQAAAAAASAASAAASTGDAAASELDATAKALQEVATEKATAAQNAFNASMLANPLFWVVTGALAVWGIVEAIDYFTMSLEEANEAIEAFDNKYEEMQGTTQEYSKNIASLEGMSDEYDRLSKKAGQYDSTIENLTETERARYEEIKNVIIGYNKDVVAAYDAEGHAILKNNDALRETIALLKEKRQEELNSAYESEEFSTAAEGRSVKLKSTKDSLSASKQQLSDFMDSGIQTQSNYIQNTLSSVINRSGASAEQKVVLDTALNKLRSLQGKTIEELKENREQYYQALNTIINSPVFDDESTPYITEAENAKKYLDNVFTTIENLNGEIEAKTQDVKKANSFSLKEIFTGLLHEDNREGYDQLVELGEQNIDAILSAYIEGLNRDDFSEGKAGVEEVVEKIKELYDPLMRVLSNEGLQQVLQEKAESANAEDFSYFQLYLNAIGARITEIIQKNPILKLIPSAMQEAIFAENFGLQGVSINPFSGVVEKVTTQYDESINKIYNHIREQTKEPISMEDFLKVLDPSQIENLEKTGAVLDQLTVRISGWKAAFEELQDNTELKETTDMAIADGQAISTAIDDVRKKLLEGKDLSKDELENINYLIGQYKEELDGVDMASQDFIDKLEDIREKTEDIAMEGVNKQLDAAETRRNRLFKDLLQLRRDLEETTDDAEKEEIEIKITADEEDLKKTLQEIEDLEIEKNVLIKADVVSDFDKAYDVAHQFEEIADQIPKNWKASVDQVKQIIESGNGAILNNCRHTADGMIQIDEEVAGAYIDGLQERTEAARKAQIQELKDQLTVAEAARDAAKKRVELLEQITQTNDVEQQKQLAKQYDTETKKYLQAKNSFEEILSSKREGDAKQVESDNEKTNAEMKNAEAIAKALIQAAEDGLKGAKEAGVAQGKIYDQLVTKANRLGEANAAAMQALKTGVPTFVSPTGNIVGQDKLHTQATVNPQVITKLNKEVDAAITDLSDSIKNFSLELSEDSEENKEIAKAVKDAADKESAFWEEQTGILEGAIGILEAGNAKLDTAQKGKGDKSKGGGKGSKGKTPKEKKEKEKKEKEPGHEDLFDDDDLDSVESKFHDIDLEIQALTKDLDKLAKLQNHYLGSALVHNLNKQLKLLKKQQSLYKDKLGIAKEELKKQKEKLQAQGVEIGKNGNIKNYTDALKQKQEEINKLTEKYNGETKEGQENLKGQLDTQKKNYSELKGQMDAYEQLKGQTIPELEAQIAEIEEMIIELQIAKFNAVIELHIDWQQFKEDYLKFKKELDEFMAQYSVFSFNTSTGEMYGQSGRWEQAQAVVQSQKELAIASVRERRDLEDEYKAELKLARSKGGREKLNEKYGDQGTTRKDWKKFLANNLETNILNTYSNERNLGEALIAAYNQSGSTPEQGKLATQLRNTIAAANSRAEQARIDAEQKMKDDQAKYKKRKKDEQARADLEQDYGEYGIALNQRKQFKNLIKSVYQDSLSEIEAARQKEVADAIEIYENGMDELADSSSLKIINASDKINKAFQNIQEASDQIINGDFMKDGGRSTSILNDAIRHGEEMAMRLSNFNESTKRDKEGNKIPGTDKLGLYSIDPLTGDRITSKKQLKRVKKELGKGKSSEVYAYMQDKLYEDGKKRAEEIQDIISSLQSHIQEAFEALIEAVDTVLEKSKEIQNDYEYLNELYDMQIQMAKILGKSDEEFREAQLKNRKKQISQYEYDATTAYEKMREAIEKEGVDSETYKMWYSQYQEAAKGYYETQLNYLSELEDKAVEVIEEISDEIEKIVTQGYGFDGWSEGWDNAKDFTDSYLDDIDKGFALTSLRNEYQKLIDDTQSPELQKAIREEMERQLEILQNSVYLSEEEVDNAKNLLDVTRKQIALKEAEQNKNKMRLRRDSQGNYTYQFVADQDEIRDKQQELLDATEKAREEAEKYSRAIADKELDIIKSYYATRKELLTAFYKNEITEEEFNKRNDWNEQRKDLWLGEEGLLTQQGARSSQNYEDNSVLALMALAENTESFEKLQEDMGITNEQLAAVKEIFQEYTSGSEGSGLISLIGKTGIKEELANGNAGTIEGLDSIKGIGEYIKGTLLEQFLPDKLVELTEDQKQKIQEEEEKLKKALEGDDGKGGIKGEINTTKEAIKQALIGNENDKPLALRMETVTNSVNANIVAQKAIQESLVSKISDWYGQYIEISEANSLAMSKANSTLDLLEAELRKLASEGEQGSGTGELKKGNFGTLGTQITKEQEEASKMYAANQKAIEKANQSTASWAQNMISTESYKITADNTLTEEQKQKAIDEVKAKYQEGGSEYQKEYETIYRSAYSQYGVADYNEQQVQKAIASAPGIDLTQGIVKAGEIIPMTVDQLKQLKYSTKASKEPTISLGENVAKSIYEIAEGHVEILKTNKKTGRVQIGYRDAKNKIQTIGWINPTDNLHGYASGGYTGDWAGNDGRLALLHKKEMVLNQDDTVKMLNAVELARSITDAVRSLGLSTTIQLSNMLGGLQQSNGTVEQDVLIKAEFPNVTNHNEIEEALMNLVNVASQKANPNRRKY